MQYWYCGQLFGDICDLLYYSTPKQPNKLQLIQTQENTNNENRKAQEKKNKPKRKGFQTDDTVFASAIGMEQAQFTI